MTPRVFTLLCMEERRRLFQFVCCTLNRQSKIKKKAMGIDYQFPFLGICRSAINTCLYGYGHICVVDEVNPNRL